MDEMTTENYMPFVVSRPNETPEGLRAAMDEHGYVFIPGLVPAEVVLQVRRDILLLCEEAGWLDPQSDLMDGVVAPGMRPTMEGQPEYMPTYRRILKQTPSFHALPLHPALMRVAADLLSVDTDDVLLHTRRIGRITFPNNPEATTPPHQDHFYIRGTVDTYSCWMPLGACPLSLGGLAIAPGTHRWGFQEHSVKVPAAVGGRGVPTDEIREWHTSDFAPGDALLFQSYTVHKALPNESGYRLRISTDNRYQRKDEDIDPGALRVHYDL